MFVEMDLHKNYLQSIAVMNNKGKILENSRIDNNLKQVGAFFDNLNDEKTRIAIESSCVWYNIYSYLSEEKYLNPNPIKTRAIASAKIKTDKLDAIKLANLLRGGYIAECYVPDRTKLKNKIHSIVLMRVFKYLISVVHLSHLSG